MRLAAKIKRLFANLTGRDRLETTLDAELRVYLDEMTERKIRQGIPPSEARRMLVEAFAAEVIERIEDDTAMRAHLGRHVARWLAGGVA